MAITVCYKRKPLSELLEASEQATVSYKKMSSSTSDLLDTPYINLPECQRTPCSKQAPYLKFK